MTNLARRAHWDERYRTVGAGSVSWFESRPSLSLAMIEFAGLEPGDSVIDVGGGASSLSAELIGRGVNDVTVLDVSDEALTVARDHFDDPSVVKWITQDLLDWQPQRSWDLWHDRAVFHFLTESSQRRLYRDRLQMALAPSGTVCMATFAVDGPPQCSGLDVVRWSPDDLLAELGNDFAEIAQGRHLHVTPSGGVQPFSWIVARHRG